MESLLFLVHRIPYPPNKGDKIRSFHMLKYLAEKYEVFLGAFIDDDDDWQYQKDVEKFCHEICLRPLNPTLSKLKSLIGFLTNNALTVPYYWDKKLQDWVRQVISDNEISKVIIFSSSMAQYVDHDEFSSMTRIIDFVDVDSDKWAQYSESKRWPESFVYRREAKYLLNYERQITSKFDASLFVSEDEAEHFKKLENNNPEKVDYFYNGVDTEYFDPAKSHDSPYNNSELAIVFTGAMDYWANVNAVTWFAEEVFPLVRKNRSVKFYIVGSNPSAEVKNLATLDGIEVTGRVPDIRPYLLHAELVVAPLRIARGIQNKVLEAMSMECCVLATSDAAKGIASSSGECLYIKDNPVEFAEQAIVLLTEKSVRHEVGKKARKYVLENFSWESNLAKLEALLGDSITIRKLSQKVV